MDDAIVKSIEAWASKIETWSKGFEAKYNEDAEVLKDLLADFNERLSVLEEALTKPRIYFSTSKDSKDFGDCEDQEEEE